VVIALKDPDPRTAGKGMELLREAGIEVKLGIGREAAARSMAGFLTRMRTGRPRITLKLALSIDGKIALPSGESKWITGEDARAHVHLERAQSDMILVGRGTYLADAPKLDVRLPGLEDWSPRRALLTRGEAVDGWEILHSPQDVYRLHDVNDLLVEGGSATATAFLSADLVDRILIYRAPIIVGEGKSSFGYIGLDAIADAHGRWRMSDGKGLGIDRLEVYERVREG
jgi:diaminohydroxyphosphoribosylaminopyrimidine deaminase/5-amino-6-(5-phosphoribosylamino)uracil reductase